MSVHLNNTWIIIPAYNEAVYLATVLKKTKKITKQIVVVDDGSTDQTAKIAHRFTPHVLRHELNLGKGAALKTGCDCAFKYLGARAVVMLDSDDQHDPREILNFISQLQHRARVVFGERQMGSEMPFIRIFFNRLASFAVWAVFGSYIPDIPSGY